ncbi:MAG: hypothetical protein V4574_04735 [Pseudomonadota bacterium]
MSAGAIGSALDAMPFLDAYLQGERDWTSAIMRYSLFRMPSFKEKYEGLSEAVIEIDGNNIDSEDFFDAHFRRVAGQVATPLVSAGGRQKSPWTEAHFGQNQLQNAKSGTGMRFDKAVTAALTYNRIARDFKLGDSFVFEPHSIVACAFYFPDLRRLIQRFGGPKGIERDDAAFQAGCEAIAALTEQPPAVVRDLAGTWPEGSNTLDLQKAASHLGSYPTLFEILKVLATKLPDMKAVLENEKLIEKHIIRRRVKMHVPRINGDEVIEPFGRITTGPYAWPEDDYPEGAPFPDMTPREPARSS